MDTTDHDAARWSQRDTCPQTRLRPLVGAFRVVSCAGGSSQLDELEAGRPGRPTCLEQARNAMRSTTDRGYGTEHQARRKVWAEYMAVHGGVDCHAEVCFYEAEAGRWIDVDDLWDLGHTLDRTDWTGPEHRYCNRKEPQLRGQVEQGHVEPKRWVL